METKEIISKLGLESGLIVFKKYGKRNEITLTNLIDIMKEQGSNTYKVLGMSSDTFINNLSKIFIYKQPKVRWHTYKR